MCSEYRGDDRTALRLLGSCCPGNTAAESRGEHHVALPPLCTLCTSTFQNRKERDVAGVDEEDEAAGGAGDVFEDNGEFWKVRKIKSLLIGRNKIFGKVAKQPSKGVAFLLVWWCKLPKASKAPWPKR